MNLPMLMQRKGKRLKRKTIKPDRLIVYGPIARVGQWGFFVRDRRFASHSYALYHSVHNWHWDLKPTELFAILSITGH